MTENRVHDLVYLMGELHGVGRQCPALASVMERASVCVSAELARAQVDTLEDVARACPDLDDTLKVGEGYGGTVSIGDAVARVEARSSASSDGVCYVKNCTLASLNPAYPAYPLCQEHYIKWAARPRNARTVADYVEWLESEGGQKDE